MKRTELQKEADRIWEEKLAKEDAQEKLEWVGFLVVVAIAIVAFSGFVFMM